MNGNVRIETEKGDTLICDMFGVRAIAPFGTYLVRDIIRKRNAVYRRLTIETYARTFTIDCEDGMYFATEDGFKRADQLRAGDAIRIRGVYVPFRYSVIKQIRRKKGGLVCYRLPSGSECVANGMLVKF